VQRRIQLVDIRIGEQVSEHYDLVTHNTMGLHCDAQYFVSVTSEDELRAALSWAQQKRLDVSVIGGGSNIIFAPTLNGLVVHMAMKGIRFEGQHVIAAAGESWQNLVDTSISNELFGLENLSLIPGTVGAAPMQNIGAYGVELADFFVSLLAMHVVTGEMHVFDRTQCGFGYRQSVFKGELKNQFIIVSVTLALESDFTPRLDYPDLQARFATSHCTARQVADAVTEIRQGKLPDPFKVGNTGSFFKNPELTPDQHRSVAGRLDGVPVHRIKDGRVKISAAALIEKVGLKGHSLKGAGVSEQHALVIVNLGEAKSAHILGLATEIMTAVESRFDIKLEIEPVRLGFTDIN